MINSRFQSFVDVYICDIVIFLYKIGEALLDSSIRPYISTAVCSDMFDNFVGQEGYEADGVRRPTEKDDYHLHFRGYSNVSIVCSESQRLPDEIANEVQQQAAGLFIAYRLLVSIPAVILGLFCGAWSDREGCKLPMMTPSAGSCAAVLFYLLSLHVQRGKVALLLAGAAMQGAFGKNSVITMAVNSHVSHTSPSEERTRRLGRLLACNYLGMFLGALLAGILQDVSGLSNTLTVVSVCHALCVFAILLGVSDVVPSEMADNGNHFPSLDSDTTNSLNPDTTNSPNPDTTNSPNPDTTNSPNPDTTSSLNRDTINSLNRDTINSLNRDTTNSLNRDTINSLNCDTTNSLNRDTTNHIHIILDRPTGIKTEGRREGGEGGGGKKTDGTEKGKKTDRKGKQKKTEGKDKRKKADVDTDGRKHAGSIEEGRTVEENTEEMAEKGQVTEGGKTGEGGGRKKVKEHRLFSWEGLMESLTTVVKKREGGKRCVIILCLVVITVTQILKVGDQDVTVMFVQHPPLSWPPYLYGYLNAADSGMMGMALLLFLPVLSNVLAAPDVRIVQLGVVFKLCRPLWAGFCTTTWMIFTSVLIGALGGVVSPALRSILSKTAREGEVGKLFSIQAALETLSKLIGSGVFTGIYAATVDLFPPAAYLAEVLVYLLMVALVLWLGRLLKEDGVHELLLAVVRPKCSRSEEDGSARKAGSDSSSSSSSSSTSSLSLSLLSVDDSRVGLVARGQREKRKGGNFFHYGSASTP